MEKRFIRQNLVMKKGIDYVYVAPKQSVKRKSEPVTDRKVILKKDEIPKFTISYEKFHSPLILHSSQISVGSFLIQEDNEEYSLELRPYRKTLTLKTFSYIEAINEVENLLKSYETQHKALKPTKSCRKRQPNNSNMNKLQQTNVKISLAQPFLNSNFKMLANFLLELNESF
jgi:hypothetical protein